MTTDEQSVPTGAVENDPLSEAAAGVEAPKYPVLATDRVCRFRVASCTKEKSKDEKKPNSENLTIVLETTKEYADEDGHMLKEGWKSTTWIGITPSKAPEGSKKKDYTIDDIKAQCSLFLRCCFGIEKTKSISTRDLLNNPSMVNGSIVDCKVSIRPERDGYPKSNGFKFIEPGQ